MSPTQYPVQQWTCKVAHWPARLTLRCLKVWWEFCTSMSDTLYTVMPSANQKLRAMGKTPNQMDTMGTTHRPGVTMQLTMYENTEEHVIRRWKGVRPRSKSGHLDENMI